METKINASFLDILWKNFAASIDMLSNIIDICPNDIWQSDRKIFYMTYHTVIFLDYYLTSPVKDFQPVLTYTIANAGQLPVDAIDDVLPDRLYSKSEMIDYLSAIRKKCKKLILQSPVEKFKEPWIHADEISMHDLCPGIVVHYNLLEILFYNFRHVQHHVAQLNLLLRQKVNLAADWIAEAE